MDSSKVSPRSIAYLSTSTSMNSQSSDTMYVKNSVENNLTMLPLITEAINETIAETNCRGKEISELLSHLEIDPKSMPKDIEDSLVKVAAILRVEGLSSMDRLSLTLHMERNKRDTMRNRQEERMHKNRFDHIQNKQIRVSERTNQAQDSIHTLAKVLNNGSNNEKGHANRIVNAVKLNDYREILTKSEVSLDELGVNDYSPEKILNKYDVCLKLKEEVKKVEQLLSKYGDLPPNLSEARVKLADKEKYLKDLDQALFQKMK